MSTSSLTVSRRGFIAGAGAGVAAAATSLAVTTTVFASDEETPAIEGAPSHRWQSQAAADWRVAPEPIAEDQIADGGTYDVVIVGGGQSGTWTARSAATFCLCQPCCFWAPMRLRSIPPATSPNPQRSLPTSRPLRRPTGFHPASARFWSYGCPETALIT